MKESGKDSSADFILEFARESSPALSFSRRGFADKVKLAFSRQFFPKISMQDAIKWCNEFKFTGEINLNWGGDFYDQSSAVVSGRDAIANFATEGARDIYGDDFWVDQLLPIGEWDMKDGYQLWEAEFMDHASQVPDLCVITDVRFENEVERISDLDGFLWKIKRESAEQTVIEEARQQERKIHRSELGLPDYLFDEIIDNNSSLDDLRSEVFSRCEALMVKIAGRGLPK